MGNQSTTIASFLILKNVFSLQILSLIAIFMELGTNSNSSHFDKNIWEYKLFPILDLFTYSTTTKKEFSKELLNSKYVRNYAAKHAYKVGMYISSITANLLTKLRTNISYLLIDPLDI